MSETLQTREAVLNEVAKAVAGKDMVIVMVFMAMLAGSWISHSVPGIPTDRFQRTIVERQLHFMRS